MGTQIEIDRKQEIFRELMGAMARPGRLTGITPSKVGILTDVLDVLLDHEVVFCVLGENKDLLEKRITAATGSMPAGIGSADFVITAACDTGDELYKAKRGSLEYPDNGATVIYYSAAPQGNKNNQDFIFKGPGIAPGSGPVSPGIPENELKKLSEINSDYPLGLDVVIISGNSLLCIPRSSKITGVK
jgi:alpha-D-ribose 1-methylphosphonate 5-triphosphate synthase subunit PhnH